MIVKINDIVGLGTILQPPQSVSASVGTTTNFSCTAVGNVFWEINGAQISMQSMVEAFARAGIFVPLSTPDHSTVLINATQTTNGTTVRCLVEEPGNIQILNASARAQLLVFGKYSRKHTTVDSP